MKTVLVCLNSQYVHLSPAPWVLKAACGPEAGEIEVIDTTVNRSARDILREICGHRPDLVGFTCYIFNIIQIERIVNDLKKVLPEASVVLGGPEVSYDPEDVLAHCPGADYVVSGEGEAPLRSLLRALARGGAPAGIPGLASRRPDGGFDVCPPARPENAPAPVPDEMLERAKGKILYFESSRGCPFACGYCLSSLSPGVRFFPMDGVKESLLRVMRSGARQVKFVDRTFNANPGRALEILRFILEAAQADPQGAGAKNYHFEAGADLFDEPLLECLNAAPRGLFQLELGIQSLHPQTLAAVSRKTDADAARRNIARLLAPGNVHIHLDLIAGLPHEDYAAFSRSFDGVYALLPHALQLGFLKLLKGSPLRRDPGGIVFESLPPYEVLRTPVLSFGELSRLHDIAECVDRLHNSGRFMLSLRFLTGRFGSAFAFFEGFAAFARAQGAFESPVSSASLTGLVLSFARGRLPEREAEAVGELLTFDYFAADNACSPPAALRRRHDPALKELARALGGAGRVHVENFPFDPRRFGEEPWEPVTLCFDYGARDPVTGLYAVRRVR